MDKKIQVLPNSQNKINQENKKRRGSYQNGITCINSVWSSPDFIFQNSKKEVMRVKLKAWEILNRCNIEKCPECKCAVSDDWTFVDFSGEEIIKCPQCGNLIYIKNLTFGGGEE